MAISSIQSNPNRLKALNLARFVAYAGMVFVNFHMVMGSPVDGPYFLYYFNDLLSGRAAASLIIIAGLAFGLNKGARHIKSTMVKRAFFLFILGFFNSLVFKADILHYYSFYFFIGIFCLELNKKSLVAAIVLLNVTFVLLNLNFDYKANWDWHHMHYLDFWSINGYIRNLIFNGWHPIIPWFSFLLVGFFLSKFDLTCRKVQVVIIYCGIALIMLSNFLSYLLTPLFNYNFGHTQAEFFLSIQTMPPMPLYMLSSSGATIILLAFCLLIFPIIENKALFKPIIATGDLTLSLYFAHIIIGINLLKILGFVTNEQPMTIVFAISLLFILISMLFSTVWLKYYKRGPIEYLMKRACG